MTEITTSWSSGCPLTIERIDAIKGRCYYADHLIQQELVYGAHVPVRVGLAQLSEINL